VRRRESKNPSIVSHILLVVAPPLAACLMAAAHASLGDFLNLLWLLGTAGVFAHWILYSRPGPCSRWTELLGLTLALALLFPVISADDDRLQFELPNDVQSLFSTPEKQKHFPASAKLHSPEMMTVRFIPSLVHFLELVPRSGSVATIVLSSHTPGNHSPPLC
jgi:hypothetical protein